MAAVVDRAIEGAAAVHWGVAGFLTILWSIFLVRFFGSDTA